MYVIKITVWKVLKWKKNCTKNKKKPVLVRSQTGEFHNVQEAEGIFTDLLGMREA
jgi:hypothetical protein